MKQPSSRKPFSEAAIAAFPFNGRDDARTALLELSAVVDDSYRQPPEHMYVNGASVSIPRRLHFQNGAPALAHPDGLSLASRCLLTRATDGHLRQKALLAILGATTPWAIPYVVLLIGEYVVEIVQEIEAALPRLDQGAYANFVRENRPMMRLLRARVTSYWDAYYRNDYPSRATYPGLAILNQLDAWAS